MDKPSNIIIFRRHKPKGNIIVRKTRSIIYYIVIKMLKIYARGLEMIDEVLIISYDD